MNVLDSKVMKGFVRMVTDGWELNFHERNGGNASYRMKPEEVEEIKDSLDFSKPWVEIGETATNLANEFFIVTGSGKYFRNVQLDPADTCCIIEIDASGSRYRVVWGLVNGGKPTSELPAHILNHSVKCEATGGTHRVLYHGHPANVIALTFVLPLNDEVFTRELWEMITECPMIFPEGVGVLEWMVPGSDHIAQATSEKMKKYDVVIWAHHGMFASGVDFDSTIGLFHLVEKSAEVLVKVISMGGKKQTTSIQNLKDLDADLGLNIENRFLFEK